MQSTKRRKSLRSHKKGGRYKTSVARELLPQPPTTEGILWGHALYCLAPRATHAAEIYLM